MKLSTLQRFALISCLSCIPLFIHAQDCELELSLADSISTSCNECVTVEADFTPVNSTNTYAVSALEEAIPPYPLNQGQIVVSNIDDTYSPLIPMGFSFCFFDNTYNSIVIGSNGVVTFDAADANGFCPWSFDQTAPDPGLPNNAIFCPFHDINPASCGDVRWEIYGEEPCREFVVSFNNVCMFSCTSNQSSSQLVLHESSNTIDVYIVDKPACSWNGGNTLIGIQNVTSTVAYTPPGRNTGNWTASDEAWRFSPAGESSGDITWYLGDEEIGTGSTFEYCPDTASYLYAALNYDFCAPALIGDDCAFYDISVNSGTWPTEVDWNLVNSQGVTVLTGGAPFNQNVCLPNDCYTLNMFDSFGDGWNGASWTIAYQGTNITTATLPGGSIGSANFCVDEYVDDPDEPEEILAFALDSVWVDVLFDDIDPGLEPIDLLCDYDDPVQLEVAVDEGEWDASCQGCIDENGLFTAEGLPAGQYEVSYTVIGECGPVTDVIDIQVEEPPLIELSAPETLCDYFDPVQVESNVANGEWTASCDDCINAISGVFDPSGLAPGDYLISYTAGENCQSTSEIEIEIDESLTSPINATEPLCEEDTQQIEAVIDGGIWSADCGNCINENTGLFDGNVSGAGDFVITYTFDSFCAVPTTETISVAPSVDATISSIPLLCESGSTIVLEGAEPNGLWNSECGDCLTEGGVFDPQVSGSGIFQVSYALEGVCSDFDQQNVEVLVQRDATITVSPELCIDEGTHQLAVFDVGGEWSASCDDCIDSETGILDLTEAGEGEVTVFYVFEGLCGDDDEATFVIVPCSIEIPNIFSPNNDGINDEFRFNNLEFFPGSSLEIYNRWGILVYESADYANNWTAENVADGTYYYFLQRGDGELFKGTVTIKR